VLTEDHECVLKLSIIRKHTSSKGPTIGSKQRYHARLSVCFRHVIERQDLERSRRKSLTLTMPVNKMVKDLMTVHSSLLYPTLRNGPDTIRPPWRWPLFTFTHFLTDGRARSFNFIVNRHHCFKTEIYEAANCQQPTWRSTLETTISQSSFIRGHRHNEMSSFIRHH
jgi:hypothetical protein